MRFSFFKRVIAFSAVTLFYWNALYAQKTVTFPSKDGLLITADLYEADARFPFILLCHQARSSRGEYLETAKRLNKLGFNCLAVDLRSGHHINEIRNETAALATVKGLTPNYLDAKQDIEAAVDWLVSNKTNGHRIYAIGSSYSASLLTLVAGHNNYIKSLVLFGPGEYFDGKVIVKNELKNFSTSCLVLCTSIERPYCNDMFAGLKNIEFYSPQNGGEHGAKALWKNSALNQDYWISLIAFLEKEKRK